ncbi:Protein T22C8.6 [Aphelenchoides avenae]|nr:Protein T22C8.6 [Aphelenchus avenae]
MQESLRTEPEAKRTPAGLKRRDFVDSPSSANTIDPRVRSPSPLPGDSSSPPRITNVSQLKELCTKFYPLAARHCNRKDLRKEYVAKCMGYFRDCGPFIPNGDPLQAISDSFTSGVGLNLGSWEVKGLPFYPINEEGAFGAGHYANVPFGAWGGGFSSNLGVRDYWSQTFDVGANWIDGRYGYRTGWSVPLVQSLGVEGGGGTDVNVPIRPDKLGTVDVDNHYGVGGYYKHNQHTGVDWRRGEVKSQFGVGVPFAGVGVNTGVGVAFPGLDTFLGMGR